MLLDYISGRIGSVSMKLRAVGSSADRALWETAQCTTTYLSKCGLSPPVLWVDVFLAEDPCAPVLMPHFVMHESTQSPVYRTIGGGHQCYKPN